MELKFKCVKCKEWKLADSFYMCRAKGVLYRKHSCKLCFNLQKNRNIRRKRFLEMTENISYKKHERFKDKKERFSDDPGGALQEGDIYN